MPLLAPPPIELNETEREELQQLVRRHQTPQQISLRARIILLAAEGKNHRDIARALQPGFLTKNEETGFKNCENAITTKLPAVP